MVSSFKSEIYFGSDPTLILFLLFLYVGKTTLFYSIFEKFPPIAAIFLFLTGPDSDGYQSRISQSGFFQIQIIYLFPMGTV